MSPPLSASATKGNARSTALDERNSTATFGTAAKRRAVGTSCPRRTTTKRRGVRCTTQRSAQIQRLPGVPDLSRRQAYAVMLEFEGRPTAETRTRLPDERRERRRDFGLRECNRVRYKVEARGLNTPRVLTKECPRKSRNNLTNVSRVFDAFPLATTSAKRISTQ